MFTSRPPHVTGVMFASRNQYIRDQELLLAEIAQQQGVKTGAVISNSVLGSATKFGQGFDDYIETYKILQGPLGYRADTVTTAAARWLGGRTSDEPFFLWVHYVDPHATYVPGFPFCQPDQGLYTPTRLSARQISSAHVIPLPTPVSWGRARRETDWSPCFQGISQAPLHTCALSSPLRCTQAARQPPGTGSAQILRSMSPNSRRVR